MIILVRSNNHLIRYNKTVLTNGKVLQNSCWGCWVLTPISFIQCLDGEVFRELQILLLEQQIAIEQNVGIFALTCVFWHTCYTCKNCCMSWSSYSWPVCNTILKLLHNSFWSVCSMLDGHQPCDLPKHQSPTTCWGRWGNAPSRRLPSLAWDCRTPRLADLSRGTSRRWCSLVLTRLDPLCGTILYIYIHICYIHLQYGNM